MVNFIGRQLGHYRLERLLGAGGFAEVYLATHVRLNTQAAIKVLHTQLREEKMGQFLNEARAIANLKHPHIVRMLDFGIEDGQIPYLVMDYLPGGTLRQYYTREEPLPLTKIALYIRQIAEALQYAHDARYIHRDVKPDNMLMTVDSHLLLSDFSLAVIAHSTSSQFSQQIAGTAIYMAPEQIEQYPRPASDQYALGVVVYEWLCGQPPFSGTILEVATKHCLTPPPPLRMHNSAIPPAVEHVVLRALRKDWQARFPSVREFAQALQQASHESTATSIRPRREVEPPPLAEPFLTGTRPSYHQRSRLPMFKEKTSIKKQALWMLAFLASVLVWWFPILMLGDRATSDTGFSVYAFILISVLMPTGALLAGALFGAWRGVLVTAWYTICIALLFGAGVIWGVNISGSTTISLLFVLATWILAPLVVGSIQQRRSRRGFGRSYLLMLLGATIIMFGWTPGIFRGVMAEGVLNVLTIFFGLLYLLIAPVIACFLALPAAMIESLIQYNIGQDEHRYS
jgi:serine/threonine protein kinase